MTAQLTSLLTAGAKLKLFHSRSTNLLKAGASQRSSLSSPPPATGAYTLAGRNQSVVVVYLWPTTHVTSLLLAGALSQLSCRLSATTGTLTCTAEIREWLFDHAPLQFYTINYLWFRSIRGKDDGNAKTFDSSRIKSSTQKAWSSLCYFGRYVILAVVYFCMQYLFLV
jgi:hypothetical protein